MNTEDVCIRPMSREEYVIAIDWAAAEGWNPGRADADCFRIPDPDGFLIGEVAGEPVACISTIRYGPSYGFLGFYIVAPGWRGRGLGLRIWQEAMRHLGGRTIGLDGVVDQQANYRKSGFTLAHRNVRYGGAVAVDMPDEAALVDAGGLPTEEVLAYDRAFFPAPREGFIRGWLTAPGHAALALRGGDGGLRGYGVLRPCREGYKIGPLFADDEAGADLLFRGLAAQAHSGPVFLDPPEPNGPAVALARRYGLEPCFETARMYRGEAPDLPLARTYGITTFELG